MRRDDGDEIASGIAARIEDVLSELAPGWVRRGQKGYLTPKGPKDLGSFTVNVAGAHRGTWHRFSQQIGGGPMKLVAYLLNGGVEPSKDDYKRAFEWGRGFLGMGPVESESDRKAREERAERDRRQRAQDEAARAKREQAERRRRADTAEGIWRECKPIAGTPAEAYLLARRIPAVASWPWSPDGTLGFHPDLDHQDGGAWPALVGRVQDPFDDTIAIWRIYLDRKKPTKAPVENAKLGLGPARGGAVRVGGIGPRIGVAEGLESALSAWALEGFRFPVWSTLSTSGMAGFDPPLAVQRVDVFPDGDAALLVQGRVQIPPGLKAARALAAKLRPTGIKTVLNEAALSGDANDFLEEW